MSAALTTVVSFVKGKINIEICTVDDNATDAELRFIQVFHFASETVGEVIMERLNGGKMCHLKDIKSYSAQLAIAALDKMKITGSEEVSE